MNRTSNFEDDIILALFRNGEAPKDIEAVVLQESYDEERIVPEGFLHTPVSWESVHEHFNYEYHAGFGSADCHFPIIYTAAHIYYVHEYDGATCIVSIPRNPTPIK